jgi:peptidoglycan/LPS O-acetylase OafA/YrhL
VRTAVVGTTPDKKMGFRPDIEGLRGIAVLLVLVNHVTSWVTGGYVGVDVFFVISGFLITLLLIRELKQTGRIAFKQFYARRVRRILPAATAVIIATMCGSWLWGPSTQHHSVSIDGMLSAVSGINYRLATSGTDYFANTTPSPFQHYWSLAVEEQFYLFWPLLLVAAWGIGKWFGKAWLTLAVALTVITAGSLWLSVTVTQSSQPWAYFSLPTRAWELAVGGIVALASTALSHGLRARIAAPMTWIGLGLIGVAAWYFNDSTSFPGYMAIVPVYGAALVIAGGCAAPRFGAQAVLGLMPLRFVGKISYSLYLWHWPVVVLAPSFLGRELTGLDRAAVVALSFVLAIVSYYAVEEPFRRNRSLAADPDKALAVGGGTIFATALAMAAVAFIVVPLPREGDVEAKEPPPIATVDIPRAVAEGAQQQKLTPEVITALPAAVGDKYPHTCLLGEFTAIEPTTCIIGDESA